MHDAPRIHAFAIFAACLAVSLDACGGVTARANSATKEPMHNSMEDQRVPAPSAPFSAETILAKFVQLLDASRSAKDLTPERLTAVFGEPLSFDGARFGFGGLLTPAWRYGINVEPESMNGPILLLNFDPSVRGEVPDATPICGIDVAEFSTRMTKIGFSRDVRFGEHGQIIAFEFSRSSLWVVVDVQGEADDPPEKVKHLCVRAITVR